MVDGSTCGRAGLLLRRMILVFLVGGSWEVSWEGFVRACDVGSVEGSKGSGKSASGVVAGLCTCTSAMTSSVCVMLAVRRQVVHRTYAV
jgi:hypothetical protein